MAAIVNDRDVLLQAASVRKLTTAGVAVVPTPSSSNFYARADGSHGPDYVRISVTTILCDGPFTFAVQGAKLSNITATTADIAYADMTSTLAIVTVTAANAGTPVQGSCIVGLVSDGQSGQPGQNGTRGAGVYYATGGGWSDTVAKAACPGGVAIAGDVVTISNGTTYALTKKYDGSTWAALGGVYDGSLFVTGSIQAAAINTNGLVVRDLQGNPIIGIGAPLADAYIPSSVTNGISNAAQAASAANAAIANMSSDNVLSRGEKPAAQQAWSVIYNERAGLQTQAGALGVDSSAYRAKFDALESYLSSLGTAFNDNSTDTVIVGSTFNTRFSDYYLAKAALTNTMAAANKAFADSAKATADAAITAINNISSDSVLSKGEKPAANQAWGVIYNERAGLQNQAGAQGVDSSAYAAKFTALQNYLVSLGSGFTDYSTDTAIDGGVFSVRFSDYYLAKQALVNAMSAANATAAAAANSAIADPVNGLAQKLKANAQNVLAGGAGLSAGSLTWDGNGNRTGGFGIGINRLGIIGYNSTGNVTFSLDAATGSAAFAGTVYALAGSIGGMTLSSSALCSGGFNGYGWPEKDSNGNWPTGTYFGPSGVLLGNYYSGKYIQIDANGNIYAPGLTLENGQLTLISPALINAKMTTSFSASIAPVRITNQTPNVRVSTGIGVSLSGGSGASGYSYQWVFNSDTGGGSNAINATGLLSNASLSITAQCSAGWYYASASVTVTDIATGATARASVRISIQFGSGAEA